MSKKEKKIAMQLEDATVLLEHAQVAGYQLKVGKKVVGEIALLDDKFATIKDKKVDTFFKTLEQAVETIIRDYHLYR